MPERALITVTGVIPPDRAGFTDGHNHVWIDPVPGADPAAPVLNNYPELIAELCDYREAGGGTIIDCQPPGAGRDANRMAALASASGVNIVAATGYHLQRYYPVDHWLFSASSEAACQLFVDELTSGMQETLTTGEKRRAGFIKIACKTSLDASPLHLMEAAVMAALETGTGLEVHTEAGQDAERIAHTLLDFGLPAEKLILCHVDKRPDFAFHSDMAQQGIALEYDTFYRPKYKPEETTWPLLGQMLAAGYEDYIVIATDMAFPAMWARQGGDPGLTGLTQQIIPRLQALGLSEQTIAKVAGGNVVKRLSRPEEEN